MLTQSTCREDARPSATPPPRIEQIPQVVRAAKESLKDPPQVFVETAIRQNRGSIALLRERHLRARRRDAAASARWPARPGGGRGALKDYQKFLERTCCPRATGDWRIGKEKFAKKLEMELDAGPGPGADEVLPIAEAEADRVERRDVRHRPAALGQAVPRQAAPAGRRRGPPGRASAACSPSWARSTARSETWSHDAKRTAERDQGVHPATGHPAAAGPGPLRRSSRCRSSSGATRRPT